MAGPEAGMPTRPGGKPLCPGPTPVRLTTVGSCWKWGRCPGPAQDLNPIKRPWAWQDEARRCSLGAPCLLGGTGRLSQGVRLEMGRDSSVMQKLLAAYNLRTPCSLKLHFTVQMVQRLPSHLSSWNVKVLLAAVFQHFHPHGDTWGGGSSLYERNPGSGPPPGCSQSWAARQSRVQAALQPGRLLA